MPVAMTPPCGGEERFGYAYIYITWAVGGVLLCIYIDRDIGIYRYSATHYLAPSPAATSRCRSAPTARATGTVCLVIYFHSLHYQA